MKVHGEIMSVISDSVAAFHARAAKKTWAHWQLGRQSTGLRILRPEHAIRSLLPHVLRIPLSSHGATDHDNLGFGTYLLCGCVNGVTRTIRVSYRRCRLVPAPYGAFIFINLVVTACPADRKIVHHSPVTLCCLQCLLLAAPVSPTFIN